MRPDFDVYDRPWWFGKYRCVGCRQTRWVMPRWLIPWRFYHAHGEVRVTLSEALDPFRLRRRYPGRSS